MQRSTLFRSPAAGGALIRRAVGAALVLAAGASISAHAASFDCKKGQSFSEKVVCETPYLSRLDDQLAAAYKHALDVTPDRQALEDSRVAQWQWRQKNCRDAACVTNWYERRLSELHADVAQGQKAQRVSFELHLDGQNLAPEAASAVRQMKAPPAQPTAAATMPDVPVTTSTKGLTMPAPQSAHVEAGPAKVIGTNP
ncbi:lysozyme inhibitor LprI family protein [Robbsia andropogonis]|uniref:lysozyme inhibitor LprI family protein n=1 Tax=Robbsia andropogonis TaxID=28092 RepID=UPI0004672624|nr:hypothetical protein [Robbsia andropogonis]MCP1120758.1 hypothetical protein [Robbsia andropogonis]MCP1130567.1 hypothetical protein [Robbsia andropogonis]